MEEHSLGAGNFGAVFRGTWRGAPVAIKRVKGSALASPRGKDGNQSGSASGAGNHDSGSVDWAAAEAVLREALAHESLKEHPNIVRFCGTCVVGDEVWLVSELCAGGSLRDAFDKGQLQLPASTLSASSSMLSKQPLAVLTPEMRYGMRKYDWIEVYVS